MKTVYDRLWQGYRTNRGVKLTPEEIADLMNDTAIRNACDPAHRKFAEDSTSLPTYLPNGLRDDIENKI